jgi:UDP-N-acetylglucosamine pyrophosphorylase
VTMCSQNRGVMDTKLAVVIMAAGKGTRMNNPELAKVMYTVDGKPMVDHVIDLAVRLKSSRTVVIVGWQKESVMSHFRQSGKPVICVEQSPQLGTGHAVMQAKRPLEDFVGDVLVLSGDVPLLSEKTTLGLIALHRESGASATVLTAILEDPTGYGRILRDAQGHVVGIVEQKDANDQQKEILEINSGIYLFRKDRLFEGLRHITPENAQKEYYLPDVFQYFWRNKYPVRAVPADDPLEIRGVNTLQQLDEARAAYAQRAG